MSRVGLLEDNAIIARLAATMLTYVGHVVTIYEHPSECLDALHLADAYRGTSPARPTLTRVTLPVELFDAMDHLRLLGNDAAHIEAQTYDTVGKDEVEAGVELANLEAARSEAVR